MIKHILAIRNDRFGEFLLNIPAFRALKDAYPEAKLTLAVDSSVKELAQCVEYADEVVVWDNYFKKELRRYKFDVCVILNPTKEAHWLGFLDGIPLRVGYNRKWGFLLNKKIPDNKYLGLRHEVEYNLELVSLIGAKSNDQSLALGNLPSGFGTDYTGAVAIHPYTSDTLKQWPVEGFQQLAKRLSEELKSRVLIVGKDEGKGKEGFDNLGNDIINLINKTSLVELAQVLKRCKLLVSCDSGPMHLAAAVGAPAIALFRNDLPGKTARRWGPWGKGHTVIENSDLTKITVSEVFEQVKQGLLRPSL